MVQMDYSLIHRARQLLNGIHEYRVRILICAYQQAVILHNAGRQDHVLYQQQCETELREFEASETMREARTAIMRWQDATNLNERNRSVMQRAAAAIRKSRSLHERCDELNERINAALSLD